VNRSGRPDAENRPPDSGKEEVATSVADEANSNYETDKSTEDSKHSLKRPNKIR
jgi:hypothetical protein